MTFLLCGFYALVAFLIGLYLKSLRFQILQILRWLLFAAVILHLAIFFTDSANPHWITTVLLGIAAWTLSLRRSTLSVVLVLLPILILVLAVNAFQSSPNPAELPSPWIWVHILLMIAGEALFFLSAAVSVVYLAASREMKTGKRIGFFSRISNLPSMDLLLQELILVGFLFLLAGMGMGFFFARQYWDVGWLLDPKVLACVGTWIVYASLIVFRFWVPSIKGRSSAWIAVAGFISVVFLSWGVDQFFPSRHINYRITESQP